MAGQSKRDHEKIRWFVVTMECLCGLGSLSTQSRFPLKVVNICSHRSILRQREWQKKTSPGKILSNRNSLG